MAEPPGVLGRWAVRDNVTIAPADCHTPSSVVTR